jgi:hypothetical protein
MQKHELRNYKFDHVSMSDDSIIAEVSMKQGRGRDPLKILESLENRAEHAYEEMTYRRFPTMSKPDYIRLKLRQYYRQM